MLNLSLIIIIPVSYPSPSNVLLIDASPRQLTFNWNPVAPHCTAIHYKIAHNNCGDCPSTTPHNTVVCRDMNVGMNLTCSFVVQNLRTCDDIIGNRSAPVEVTLKGLDSELLGLYCHQLYSQAQLLCKKTLSVCNYCHSVLQYSAFCSCCCGHSSLFTHKRGAHWPRDKFQSSCKHKMIVNLLLIIVMTY